MDVKKYISSHNSTQMGNLFPIWHVVLVWTAAEIPIIFDEYISLILVYTELLEQSKCSSVVDEIQWLD